jgi:hypothetical protein
MALLLALVNKVTPMPLNYQPLPLAQVQMALLSMASQQMIGVVTQSPAQAMSTPLTSPALETERPL